MFNFKLFFQTNNASFKALLEKKKSEVYQNRLQKYAQTSISERDRSLSDLAQFEG